jgi:hypothetical protein
MAALRVNIETIVFILLGRNGMNANGSTILAWDGSFDGASLRVEGEALINKLLSLWREVKKDKKMGGWVHMSPASDEYKYYKSFCAGYEAYAYDRLGGLYTSECTRESFEIAIKHYGKAQVIYKLLGCEGELNAVTCNLDFARVMLRDQNFSGPKSVVQVRRSGPTAHFVKTRKDAYEFDIQAFGKNDERTILAGISYAGTLRDANCHIEAERLATKMSATSRQVIGLEHDYTKRADEMLNKCRARLVALKPDCLKKKNLCDLHGVVDFHKRFQALRYEEDEDVYVLTGPITKPRKVNEERVFNVTSDHVLLQAGCPVVCRGLKNAPHLNGKLGQVKSIYNAVDKSSFRVDNVAFYLPSTGLRFSVHFVDTSLKPAAVKLENLRIVFDLPDEAQA